MIVARTGQYFCPIKHALHILNSHERYKDFLEYGDAADYEAKLDAFRHSLEEETMKK